MPETRRKKPRRRQAPSTSPSIRLSISVAIVTNLLILGFQVTENSPFIQVHAFSIFGLPALLEAENRLGSRSSTGTIRRHSSLLASGRDYKRRGILEILDDEVSDLILEKLGKNIYHEKPIGARKEPTKRYKYATEGLSKSHRSMFATTTRRQRCVTGRYPLRITVVENPTRKWLSSSSTRSSNSISTSQLLVNGTSIDRSLASYDRFQWLDGEERTILNQESAYALVSLELLAEIHVKNPGYVNILPANAAGYSAKKKRDQGMWKTTWRQNDVFSHLLGQEEEKSEEAGQERMWITGFSLTKQCGQLNYVDVKSGYMGNVHGTSGIRWPNEVNTVPSQPYNNIHISKKCEEVLGSVDDNELQDSLLVSDGFLVPGRDNGGLHVVLKPGDDKAERRVCLTGKHGDRIRKKSSDSKNNGYDIQSEDESGWFYHRSIWIDLTGDGRQSILTARAKRPSLLNQDVSSSLSNRAQLVWLECPEPHSYHELSDLPLDVDGALFDPFHARNVPWKVRVLDDGPDVMFSVADLDTSDDTIEVIASQFFSKKLTLHSIKRGPEPKVVFRRTLDDRCGSSFSSIFADLDAGVESDAGRIVIDSGSTVPTLKSGDPFSHLLVTSHECSFADEGGVETIATQSLTTQNGHKTDEEMGANRRTEEEVGADITFKHSIDGGSLFSYRIPRGKDAWKTETWTRSVLATGFHVHGQLGNMINPGAPGFCYTFYPKKDETSARPLIAIAGDCAESAYILRPVDSKEGRDPATSYAMMCQIECGATVGSIAIGYEDFCFAPQQKGYAKIYISCYENDKVLVFALGNGEDDDTNK